jgi:outer membrane lipoprotein-sorting protein
MRKFQEFAVSCLPKWTLMLLLPLLLIHPQPISAEDQLTTIIKGIKDRYSRLPGFSVPYRREIQSKSMAMLGESGKGDLASGKMFFKPPYSLRVEQVTPKPETLVTDGNLLWWFLPHKKQVYRYPALKFGRQLRLLSDIFHGLRMVGETFEISMLDDGPDGQHKLQLVPNPPWPEIQRILILVSEDDNRIGTVEIFNQMGGLTRFILGDMRIEENFQEGFFRFKVPEDVKLIDETN